MSSYPRGGEAVLLDNDMESLLSAIQEARALGRKSTDAMPLHVRQLKLALTRFIHPERFGKFYKAKGEAKASPKHANPKGAKFVETFNTVRLARTLEATKENGGFHFYVSRPDRPHFLLMLDVDYHEDDGLDSDAWELALCVLENEFPDMFSRVWTSVSRNGRGFYVYFLVENPAKLNGDSYMGADDFARRLREFNRYLKAKYNGKSHDWNGETRVFRAEVDAVKGSPFLKVDWERYLRGEDKIDNRGTLATIPLTGVRANPSSLDDGKGLITRFVAWVKSANTTAFTASYFFRNLPRLPVVPLSDSVVREGGVEEASEAKGEAVEAVLSPSVPLSESVVEKRGVEEGGAAGWDDLERMNNTGWRLSMRLGRAATYTEIWNEYEKRFNPDHDRDGNRARLCRESAEFCARVYSPCKNGYASECFLPLVNRYVTQDVRDRVRLKNRASYTSEQLAAVLYVIEKGATTRHKKPSLQFSCPNNSLVVMLGKIGLELGDEKEAVLKRLAAIKLALVHAGLAEVVYQHRQGRGRGYGLGVNHPERDAYLELYKSVRTKAA